MQTTACVALGTITIAHASYKDEHSLPAHKQRPFRQSRQTWYGVQTPYAPPSTVVGKRPATTSQPELNGSSLQAPAVTFARRNSHGGMSPEPAPCRGGGRRRGRRRAARACAPSRARRPRGRGRACARRARARARAAPSGRRARGRARARARARAWARAAAAAAAAPSRARAAARAPSPAPAEPIRALYRSALPQRSNAAHTRCARAGVSGRARARATAAADARSCLRALCR